MADTISGSSDPWQFGEKLKSDATEINRFLEHRKPSASTLEKLAPNLQELTEKYKDIPVYGSSPSMYSPVNGGVGYGLGFATGRLVGFSIDQLNPITGRRRTDPRAIRLGVIALVGESMFRAGYSTDTEPSWRLNVLPEEVRKHYAKPGFIVGVPTGEEARFLKRHEYRIPENISEVIEAPNRTVDPCIIQETIDTINALGNGDAIDEAIDPIHRNAILAEIDFLNKTSPFIGNSGTYNAPLSWSPSLVRPNGSTLRRDKTVTGDFRKYIYGPYPDGDDNIKYAVQLVVYPHVMTDKVRTGALTPQQVDSTHATYIVFA